MREETSQSAWDKAEESATVVHGPVPNPSHWKELSLKVLEPRVLVVPIYQFSACVTWYNISKMHAFRMF